MKNLFTVLRSKGAKVAAASTALAVTSASSLAALPLEVQTEIDAIVADVVSLSSIIMLAVIAVTGAFVIVKWVRRGMNKV